MILNQSIYFFDITDDLSRWILSWAMLSSLFASAFRRIYFESESFIQVPGRIIILHMQCNGTMAEFKHFFYQD